LLNRTCDIGDVVGSDVQLRRLVLTSLCPAATLLRPRAIRGSPQGRLTSASPDRETSLTSGCRPICGRHHRYQSQRSCKLTATLTARGTLTAQT
jgi:hypothetical protein